MPVEAADELQHEGVGFAGYAVGAIGQEPSDPDLIAIPDLASYTPLPWVREGLALVHCDPHVEGKPWQFAPRVILKRLLAEAAARSSSCSPAPRSSTSWSTGTPTAGSPPADAKDVAARPCYDARGLTRMYDHLTGVSAAMNALGWGNYANDHEDANGQFEQNFAYADALTTADRVITARYLISVLAEQRGMIATFMPKPFADRTGSGMHLHLSLWRDGESAVPRRRRPPRARAVPAGLPVPGRDPRPRPGPAGRARADRELLQAHRCDLDPVGRDLVAAPAHVRRQRPHPLRPGPGPATGSSCAAATARPTPTSRMAAALAAGLDGIDRDLDPGGPGTGADAVARPDLPPTLLHAVDALAADPVVTAALDAAGPGVADYFAALKREEFFDWHGTVGSWEHDRYLTAF